MIIGSNKLYLNIRQTLLLKYDIQLQILDRFKVRRGTERTGFSLCPVRMEIHSLVTVASDHANHSRHSYG